MPSFGEYILYFNNISAIKETATKAASTATTVVNKTVSTVKSGTSSNATAKVASSEKTGDFRKNNVEIMPDLYRHVITIAMDLGYVSLGHVSIDGSKIKADASKHKAMLRERMKKEIERLENEICEALEKAGQDDEQESQMALFPELNAINREEITKNKIIKNILHLFFSHICCLCRCLILEIATIFTFTTTYIPHM